MCMCTHRGGRRYVGPPDRDASSRRYVTAGQGRKVRNIPRDSRTHARAVFSMP